LHLDGSRDDVARQSPSSTGSTGPASWPQPLTVCNERCRRRSTGSQCPSVLGLQPDEPGLHLDRSKGHDHQ
jgi:hypothetical protein